MEEVWKIIENFSDYEVSNLGRVRSNRRSNIGIKNYILKTKIDKGGYVTIPTLYRDDGKVKTVKVHRLVAMAFIDNPNNYAQINHIDGDKTNNRVENLEWCTHKQNFEHATKNGLRPKGEEHGRHKLTWDNVNYIRDHYKKGDKVFGAKGLAKTFGVTPRVVSLIMRNELWVI